MYLDIIEDLFKIYLACIDSYNAKIYQTINDKYTIIDRSMLTVYQYIKIIEDRKEKNEENLNVLKNYLIKQTIYSETGNIVFEIENKSKVGLYSEILDDLVIEKFLYKNRLMKKLKFNYTKMVSDKYTELLFFLELISEFSILKKLIINGNYEAKYKFEIIKNRIINYSINENDYFYKEKKEYINLIKNDTFFEGEYSNLNLVALNLKDVYRFSQCSLIKSENVLHHQYSVTIMSIIFVEYCNNVLNEKIDLYSIITKALFHDFGEYKGTEIISHFKYYNEDSKKMFAEIEEKDEKDLEKRIGHNLYNIISNYKNDKEGYMVDYIDKIIGIMKLWIETGYFNNYTIIKTINAVYQERFKKFLKIKNMDGIINKEFFVDFLREYYIYIKENLVENNLKYTLKYFTEEEINDFRTEIKTLKTNPQKFLI